MNAPVYTIPGVLPVCRHRFTVFGVRDDFLVEFATNDFQLATHAWDELSCIDFKARVFDRENGTFLKPEVMAHAHHFYFH